MPRGDRTGPMGYGPRTGRGMGYCSGYDAPGYMHPGPGMGWGRGGFYGGRWGRGFGPGWGRGYGPGRGWGWWGWGAGPYGPPYAPDEAAASEQELSELKAEAEALQDQLRAIQARIDELGQAPEGETDQL